ncbi:hypothetical protein Patl1_10785 [Pistacia atlantica]|uniref:Uncharacterized protein n=1 Tax=Pistacia atlantica TaxID=434234 RepID=A0ACC1A546_9ROSI|nr:hypothetical protein Patl1_10785 [Pistacia atlantica]
MVSKFLMALLTYCRTLRGFDLVKDRDTGNSKGYGFCVYQNALVAEDVKRASPQDPTVTDIACAALNGLKMGDKTLTVRRATARNVHVEMKLLLGKKCHKKLNIVLPAFGSGYA